MQTHPDAVLSYKLFYTHTICDIMWICSPGAWRGGVDKWSLWFAVRCPGLMFGKDSQAQVQAKVKGESAFEKTLLVSV